MKPTDFSYWLTTYLAKYLPGEVGASSNTIKSYRDTFSLFIRFCLQVQNLKPEKITLAKIDKTLIASFLKWIQETRCCSVSTRNQRLAAIHAFCKFLQYEQPELLFPLQEILTIPFKKAGKSVISYLSIEEIKMLLEQPDRHTTQGRRDLILLRLLYDTGARVQEIADLKVRDIRLESPATVKLTGKGNKTRIVPLMKPMVNLLVQYFDERNLNRQQFNEHPLFKNRSSENLTRSGISFILTKYFSKLKKTQLGNLPKSISPHILRHSKAMHLLQSGVNLIYIRDLLGHVSVQTTEIYARIDNSMKRKVLENVSSPVKSEEMPIWQNNANLLDWLKNLSNY